MSLTREDMLRELELMPVWKLREPAVLPLQAPLVASTATVAEIPAERTAEPTTEGMIGTALATDSASASETTSRLKLETERETEYETGFDPAVETDVHAAQPASPPYVDGAAERQTPIPADTMAAVEASVSGDDHAESEAAMAAHATLVEEASVSPWDEAPVFDTSPDLLPAASSETGDARRQAIMQLDWSALQRCVADCQACGLAATRTQIVFGIGDPQAEWLIVGEAPGAEEDKRGEPFVGQAGKLLDNMLAAIKLKRGENVYIANVLKCRPPENRDPHGAEVMQCDPFLKRQVELIAPRLIIALGKFAAQSLLGSDDTIGAMRGKLHSYNGVPVIVTYHPAYLLRNLPDKAKAWEDLCFAVKTMQGLQAEALQSTMQAPSSD